MSGCDFMICLRSTGTGLGKVVAPGFTSSIWPASTCFDSFGCLTNRRSAPPSSTINLLRPAPLPSKITVVPVIPTVTALVLIVAPPESNWRRDFSFARGRWFSSDPRHRRFAGQHRVKVHIFPDDLSSWVGRNRWAKVHTSAHQVPPWQIFAEATGGTRFTYANATDHLLAIAVATQISRLRF